MSTRHPLAQPFLFVFAQQGIILWKRARLLLESARLLRECVRLLQDPLRECVRFFLAGSLVRNCLPLRFFCVR